MRSRGITLSIAENLYQYAAATISISCFLFSYPHPTNPNSPPASVQPSPASVTARARRWAGRRAWIRRAGWGTGRAGWGTWAGRTVAITGRAAIPFHTHHQVPAFIHAQQHLGALPRMAGVFNRHPAGRAFLRQSSRPEARAAEHGHADAGVPIAVISHPGIERHILINHIHNAFLSPCGSSLRGVVDPEWSHPPLCRRRAMGSD